MRELVQDFYQWLGEIDDEIAQHLEQVSEDKNIPASEVAVLAISQSDRLMTANDYLVASSPDIYSMYEDIADYGFNYDVNLDNSLLQSKMPEIEKLFRNMVAFPIVHRTNWKTALNHRCLYETAAKQLLLRWCTTIRK